MPAPRFRTLAQIKRDTIISYVIYRTVGYGRIEYIETYPDMKQVIQRVLQLNTGIRKPKYFYTKEIKTKTPCTNKLFSSENNCLEMNSGGL